MTSEETIKLRRRLAEEGGWRSICLREGVMVGFPPGSPPTLAPEWERDYFEPIPDFYDIEFLGFLARVEAVVIPKNKVVNDGQLGINGGWRAGFTGCLFYEYTLTYKIGGEPEIIISFEAPTRHEAWALAIVALSDKLKEGG